MKAPFFTIAFMAWIATCAIGQTMDGHRPDATAEEEASDAVASARLAMYIKRLEGTRATSELAHDMKQIPSEEDSRMYRELSSSRFGLRYTAKEWRQLSPALKRQIMREYEQAKIEQAKIEQAKRLAKQNNPAFIGAVPDMISSEEMTRRANQIMQDSIFAVNEREAAERAQSTQEAQRRDEFSRQQTASVAEDRLNRANLEYQSARSVDSDASMDRRNQTEYDRRRAQWNADYPDYAR